MTFNGKLREPAVYLRHLRSLIKLLIGLMIVNVVINRADGLAVNIFYLHSLQKHGTPTDKLDVSQNPCFDIGHSARQQLQYFGCVSTLYY